MVFGTGEAEKSAEKNKGGKFDNEPMGEEFGFCKEKIVVSKVFKGEPMGRGERLGFGGVWLEDAR